MGLRGGPTPLDPTGPHESGDGCEIAAMDVELEPVAVQASEGSSEAAAAAGDYMVSRAPTALAMDPEPPAAVTESARGWIGILQTKETLIYIYQFP